MTNFYSEDILVERPAKLLPEYSNELFDKKCESVYQHVYDAYYGGGRSTYTAPVVH